jgi:hypothetical protein
MSRRTTVHRDTCTPAARQESSAPAPVMRPRARSCATRAGTPPPRARCRCSAVLRRLRSRASWCGSGGAARRASRPNDGRGPRGGCGRRRSEDCSSPTCRCGPRHRDNLRTGGGCAQQLPDVLLRAAPSTRSRTRPTGLTQRSPPGEADRRARFRAGLERHPRIRGRGAVRPRRCYGLMRRGTRTDQRTNTR